MRVIIAGSRSIKDYETVLQAVLESGFEVTEVVSGGAQGVDTIAEEFAAEAQLPVRVFPAAWRDISGNNGEVLVKVNSRGNEYNALAGFQRNERMAAYADALIAVWDGTSPGTKHMIDAAKRAGCDVFVYPVGQLELTS